MVITFFFVFSEQTATFALYYSLVFVTEVESVYSAVRTEFCFYLRTNSDLCHLQHKLIGFYKVFTARYGLGI
jgi:hypothetical protein